MNKLTDKEIAKIIKESKVIVDTREQKNEHILEYFDKNNILWKFQKLDSGDYSLELPEKYKHLNEFVIIEKKNSLSEIAGNFTKGRERFYREFERANDKKKHLVIEDATWKKVLVENYRSEMSSNSMIASILSFSIKYNMPVWFVGKSESPMLIWKLLYYELREKLKK